MKMHTYVINLDRSTKRWRSSQQQLDQQDAAYTRISAVDGEALTADQLAFYDPQLNQQQYYKTLGPGEIACYLSHRRVWQQIVEDDLDYALVLEDDVKVQGNIRSLSRLVETISLDWDYIKLAENPLRRKATRTIPIGDRELVVYNKIPARTCAQLVSRRGAMKLLKGSQRFGRPVDIDIQYWWEKELVVYGLLPYMFLPGAGGSEIDALVNRKQGKRSLLTKVRNMLYFYRANKFALNTRLKTHR